MKDKSGRSIFGAIEQRVERHQREVYSIGPKSAKRFSDKSDA
jgi:hypothetical protein